MTYLKTDYGMVLNVFSVPMIVTILLAAAGTLFIVRYTKGKGGVSGLVLGIISAVVAFIAFVTVLSSAGIEAQNKNENNIALNLKEKYSIEAFLTLERYDRDKHKVDVVIDGKEYTLWLSQDKQSYEPVLFSDEKVSAYDVSKLRK